jgi:hypothetical protein
MKKNTSRASSKRAKKAVLVGLAGVFMVASIGPADAAARKWALVTTSSANAKFYLDSNSLQYVTDEPSQVVMWEKITGLSDRVSGKIVRTITQRLQFDCETNQYAVGPGSGLDKAGRVVWSETAWGDWQLVSPDSVGEDLRNYACDDYDSNNG